MAREWEPEAVHLWASCHKLRLAQTTFRLCQKQRNKHHIPTTRLSHVELTRTVSVPPRVQRNHVQIGQGFQPQCLPAGHKDQLAACHHSKRESTTRKVTLSPQACI